MLSSPQGSRCSNALSPSYRSFVSVILLSFWAGFITKDALFISKASKRASIVLHACVLKYLLITVLYLLHCTVRYSYYCKVCAGSMFVAHLSSSSSSSALLSKWE